MRKRSGVVVEAACNALSASLALPIFVVCTCSMTSPGRRPACAAAESGATAVTRAPRTSCNPKAETKACGLGLYRFSRSRRCRLLARQLTEQDAELLALAVADHGQSHPRARRSLRDTVAKHRRIVDRLAVALDDDVTRQHAARRSG